MFSYHADIKEHRELFKEAVFAAALVEPKPAFLGDIFYAPERVQVWREEGRRRTAVNAAAQRARGREPKPQKALGTALTSDEMGRIGEGVVELLLDVRAPAVLDSGVDDAADLVVHGLRLDIKTSSRPTWSVSAFRVEEGLYDGFLLVEHVKDGHARAWACSLLHARDLGERRPPATPRQDPFYLLRA